MLLRETNVSSHFFLPRSNLSEDCHVSYWRESWHVTFRLIFWWLLLFCADLLVSHCQHGIGCYRAFVYCWMSCLDLKNIDQLLALQLLCFLCFLVCVIFRWSYTARISLDFPFLWHAITFYKWHRFSSFVHFPYFCTTYIFPH